MGEARGSSHFVFECQKHLICYLLSFKGLRHSHVMEQLTRLPGASGALDLLHLLLKTGGQGLGFKLLASYSGGVAVQTLYSFSRMFS